MTVVFVRRPQADDLDFLADLDDAALDAARARPCRGPRSRTRLRPASGRAGPSDAPAAGCSRPPPPSAPGSASWPSFGSLVLERHERRALDDRNVVAGELVLRQQLANFELDELEQLRIVDHVDLVHEDDERRHADLTGEQDVLAGLRHRAVGGRDDEDRAVHLRGAGDHVLHVVGVAGAVDMGVVAVLRSRIRRARSRS